jgi:hypothetical protein
MAVNRELRDAICENLAAYLRGERTAEDYTSRRNEILESLKNDEERDRVAVEACEKWWFPFAKGLIDEPAEPKVDAEVRDYLAFLASNLDIRVEEGARPPLYNGADACLFLVPAFGIVLCGFLFGWVCGSGLVVLLFMLLAWASFGVTGLLVALRRGRLGPEPDYYPFNDEKQRSDYLPLLNPYRLPTSGASTREKKFLLPDLYRQRSKGVLLWVVLLALASAVILIMLMLGPFPVRVGFRNRDRLVAFESGGHDDSR